MSRPIRGRQLLLIVHQLYKSSEELGTHSLQYAQFPY